LDTIKSSKDTDGDRRRFVGATAVSIAAAGAFRMPSEHMAAATNDDAIRPFRINVPEEPLVDPIDMK
jgi:hypothetical protein